MLVQFTVKNALSFAEEQSLVMVAASEVKGHESTALIETAFPAIGKLLRSAAIYGPNASGKTNLIKALVICQRLMTRGAGLDEPLDYFSFKLNAALRESPTTFTLTFIADDRLYTYTITYNATVVIEELLQVTQPNSTEEHLLYHRTHNSETQRAKVVFNTTNPAIYQDPENEDSQFYSFVAKELRPNQVFIYHGIERNILWLKPIKGFLSRLIILDAISDDRNVNMVLLQFISKNKINKAFLLSNLQKIDKNVSDLVQIETEDTKQPIQRELNLVNVKEGSANKWVGYAFERKDNLGNAVDFMLKEESDGTKRLLYVLPLLKFIEQNYTIVIDELDRSLHTQLVRYFIVEFLKAKKGQLIFTTHDTNLLDSTLFRDDELWFTQKNPAGATELYTLAEFDAAQLEALKQTRNNTDGLESGYLNGRFGAVPFSSDNPNLQVE